MCLDGTTGEVVWMIDGETPRTHTLLSASLSYIVGHNRDYLFAMCGDAELVCIGLESGIRYWVALVPEPGEWSGRGFVNEQLVVLPSRRDSRRIHVARADTRVEPSMKTLSLPDFSISREPLGGAVNLSLQGSYLIACYEGGIESYSSAAALTAMAAEAADSGSRASFLAQSGKQDEAIATLYDALDRADLSTAERRRLASQALSLVDEVSERLATEGHREQALATLAACQDRMSDPGHKRRVHLFRLQVYRILGDQAGIQQEQEYIENGGIK
jgi:hypothetical protein